jgi:hypothetical protein
LQSTIAYPPRSLMKEVTGPAISDCLLFIA